MAKSAWIDAPSKATDDPDGGQWKAAVAKSAWIDAPSKATDDPDGGQWKAAVAKSAWIYAPGSTSLDALVLQLPWIPSRTVVAGRHAGNCESDLTKSR